MTRLSSAIRPTLVAAVSVAVLTLGSGSALAAGGTTHEFAYHADGKKAGEAWFNSGITNPSKGRNSFTLKDLFCGDGWSVRVEYNWSTGGSSTYGHSDLDGDCSPVEKTLSIANSLGGKSYAFHWRICKWDVNHKSPMTCESWVNTTIS